MTAKGERIRGDFTGWFFGYHDVDEGDRAYERRFEARRLAGLADAAKSLGHTLVKESASE